jgi:septin family protein
VNRAFPYCVNHLKEWLKIMRGMKQQLLCKKPPLLQFETPSSFMVCGPKNSGKTWFIKRMLENVRLMFKEPPMFVLYCYGSVWQHMFDDMQQNVKVYVSTKGFPPRPNY